MILISISILTGLPFLILYNRKHEWYNPTTKKVAIIGMTLVGVIGFIISNDNNGRLFFYSLICTPIFIGVESLFKQLSIEKHNRDFYLYLKGSDDIDSSFWGIGKNKHIKTSDIVFSSMLLTLIMLLALLGVLLFGKEDLYDKLMN